jgi:hypothetical protein
MGFRIEGNNAVKIDDLVGLAQAAWDAATAEVAEVAKVPKVGAGRLVGYGTILLPDAAAARNRLERAATELSGAQGELREVMNRARKDPGGSEELREQTAKVEDQTAALRGLRSVYLSKYGKPRGES